MWARRRLRRRAARRGGPRALPRAHALQGHRAPRRRRGRGRGRGRGRAHQRLHQLRHHRLPRDAARGRARARASTCWPTRCSTRASTPPRSRARSRWCSRRSAAPTTRPHHVLADARVRDGVPRAPLPRADPRLAARACLLHARAGARLLRALVRGGELRRWCWPATSAPRTPSSRVAAPSPARAAAARAARGRRSRRSTACARRSCGAPSSAPASSCAGRRSPFAHPDAPLLDLLAFILGEGESSRLVQRVKDRERLGDRLDAVVLDAPRPRPLRRLRRPRDGAARPRSSRPWRARSRRCGTSR